MESGALEVDGPRGRRTRLEPKRAFAVYRGSNSKALGVRAHDEEENRVVDADVVETARDGEEVGELERLQPTRDPLDGRLDFRGAHAQVLLGVVDRDVHLLVVDAKLEVRHDLAGENFGSADCGFTAGFVRTSHIPVLPLSNDDLADISVSRRVAMW